MPYSILIIHIRNLLIIRIRNWDNPYSYMYLVAIHVWIRIQTYINMKYENKYDMSNIYPYMWIAIFIASLGAYVNPITFLSTSFFLLRE